MEDVGSYVGQEVVSWARRHIPMDNAYSLLTDMEFWSPR